MRILNLVQTEAVERLEKKMDEILSKVLIELKSIKEDIGELKAKSQKKGK